MANKKKEINLEQVIKLASHQLTEQEIREFFNISESTWRQKKREDPEIEKAIKKGIKEGQKKRREEIDLNYVEDLASCNLEEDEIQTFFNLGGKSWAQIKKENPGIKPAIKKGAIKGKAKLKIAQHEKALSGDSSMLIWLGKTVLKQRDDLFEEIKFKDCENRSEKMEQVIAYQAKGIISGKAAKYLIENIEKTNMQNIEDSLKNLTDLEKEANAKHNKDNQ